MFSSKIIGILALITTICVLVLIGLQVMELQHYSKSPSVWPTASR